MLSERNFTSRMIYILLFLFSLNVFNQSSLILAAVFILVVIFDRGKLYIPANDNVFVVLVFFAAVFFVFSAQNGLNAGISAIGCPMAYYIGLRVQNERIALAQAEKQLKSVTTLLVAGMTCHAVVNFLYELVRFGGINSGGTHYDFFSLGAKTSATGAATYLTLFAGVIFYLIMESNSVKKWAAGILLIVIAFAYDMILGGRTFFALTGVSFVLSMIVYIWGQKDDKKKMKAIGKLILIALVLGAVAIAVYIRYQDTITRMFESTYLFHRISYANIAQSQDLLQEFKAQPSTLMMPKMPDGSFAKKLYSLYLTYLPTDKFKYALKMNVDNRGSFTELVHTADCGQVSINISKPGITKGQHWHNSKWELFIVVAGHGLIQERNINTGETVEFEVSGDKIEAVHMVPGWTHNIINLSETENLVTVMTCNEIFDPNHPDTFFEPV